MEGTGTDTTAAAPTSAEPSVVVFTDIEGSVPLSRQMGAAYWSALALHNRLLRDLIAQHNGHVANTTGDGLLSLFPDASSAVACGVAIQQGLAGAAWPTGVPPLQVRVAVHAGSVFDLDGECVGPAVNEAARIRDTAYGGQTLVSDAAARLARAQPLPGALLLDLGPQQVRDIEQPLRLHLALAVGAPVPASVLLRTQDMLPTNLPAGVAEFVGRERELRELQALLASPDARLITLTGPGGVGKTQLMLRAGLTVKLDQFEDGVWLVELAEILEPHAVPAAIAAALRLPLSAERPDPVDALAALLAPKRLLLLLDNYEHVMPAALVPYELLRRAPYLKCAVTSRERLRLPGEHFFEVPPLALPEPEATPAEQRAAASVDLFCRRGTRARGGRSITDAELPVVVEICRRLDGLPLALELAAARLSHLTPAELRQDLRQRLDVLQSDERGVPGRLRSVRSAIEWSFGLLAPEEAEALAELAVFRGGFFPAAAQAVCGERGSPVALQQLRDKSLLRSETCLGRTRYAMLPLVQEHALERLGDGLGPCRERAARYLAQWANDLDLKGERQVHDLELVRLELDNLRAALEWAEASGSADVTRDITLGVWPRFHMEGAGDECLQRLQRAVAACRQAGDQAGLAELLVREAIIRKGKHDVEGARALLGESLAISERVGLEEARTQALMEEADILQLCGDLLQARVGFARCLETYRAAGDRWGMVVCLRSLGLIAGAQGDDLRSEALFHEALSLETPEAQPWGVTNSLYDLGCARLHRGDPLGALEALQQSVALCRQIGDRPGLVDRLTRCAEACRQTGNPARQHEALQEALALAKRYRPDLVGSLAATLAALPA